MHMAHILTLRMGSGMTFKVGGQIVEVEKLPGTSSEALIKTVQMIKKLSLIVMCTEQMERTLVEQTILNLSLSKLESN